MNTHRIVILVGLLGLGAAVPAPSVKELNDWFGLPLWAEGPLWAEDGAAVAQRLRCRVESSGTGQASFVANPSVPVLGAQPEALRLTSRDNKASSLLIMYANKGDSVSMKPVRERFKSAVDYNTALLTYEKDLAALSRRINTDATAVEAQLTRGLGAPERLTVSASGAAPEIVKLWHWKEHAIVLSVSPREAVSIRIVPPDQVRARAQHVSSADLKQEFQSRVQRRPNGDVLVGGIPMITQGDKGYCVPASWARYLQYAGITVDEYTLAKAGSTVAGGGTTSSGMASAATPILARYKRRLVSFKGTLSLSLISKYIDDGLPIMWTMRCVGPFRELGKSAKRMGEQTPEQWSNSLKQARTNAHKLPRGNTDLHMCMIIGYNKATKEIATSDSWGPGHEEKWYTLEEAQAASFNEYYIVSW